NATGVSTLYTAAGAKAGGPLVVTVAPPAGALAGFVSSPTGTVFNNVNTDFIVTNPKTGVSGSANFLFATEDGTISGRSGTAANNQTFIPPGMDNSASGAVYKGLAIAPDLRVGHLGHNVIFAANFNSGLVEEYDAGWNFVQSFTDPLLPPVP